MAYVDDPEKLPRAKFVEQVTANRSGSISQVHARLVGEAAVALGAGRSRKDDQIDYAVGLVIHRKVGDFVERGQPLFTVHANDTRKQAEAREAALAAFGWSEKLVTPLPLFYE